jgi:hypothetical protein
MTIAPITLTASEWKIINFWKEHVNAVSVQRLMDLMEEHDEYAAEAGPNGGVCDYTRELLEPIRAEIMDRVETIVERYADWATD